MTRKYGKSSQNEVKKEMRRFKKGTAHSGPKQKKVKNRKQAIAIGLSKARKKGAKVPKKPKGTKSRKTSAKKTSSRKTSKRRTSRGKKSK